MVHITTGNRVDVVYTMNPVSDEVTIGIEPWGGDMIPLPQPEGLIEALRSAMVEKDRLEPKDGRNKV